MDRVLYYTDSKVYPRLDDFSIMYSTELKKSTVFHVRRSDRTYQQIKIQMQLRDAVWPRWSAWSDALHL